jgi:hypothetical protein
MLMGGWTAIIITPAALMGRAARRGRGGRRLRLTSGVLLVVGLLGLAVMFALLVTAYVRGTRLPWVGGAGPDL